LQRKNQHRLRPDADEIGQVGDVIHAQKIMAAGIEDEQRIDALLAHRLSDFRGAALVFLFAVHDSPNSAGM
jgi:hypothetical protein